MSSLIVSGDTSGSITLSAPAVSGSSVLTLPASTDTLIGKATTDTLTNKTLTSPTISGTPVMGASLITSGTAQASTSGTSIDFTGIPSWVKRITVMFSGVSTNGTTALQIQLFASTVLVTSGYAGYAARWGITPANVYTASSTAFVLSDTIAATYTAYGTYILTPLSGNTWVIFGGMTTTSTTGSSSQINGANPLASVLTGIRITTVNGTDTFDAGSINILYE